MATYKLIQDVEAEDHILGPLTLRQFIFALIACFCMWLCFFVITQHLAFLLIILLPPTLFFLFFALPLGRDQPTEIWALAKLRYYFKPRMRVWNQDGVKELVTITAPKRIEVVRTNGLSQTEVKSRLQALADTLDTRGWAVKNALAPTYSGPFENSSPDRLLDLDTAPQPVPDNDVPASADILDEVANPLAKQFSNMIDQSAQTHRQQIVSQLNDDSASQVKQDDYWFMNGNPSAPSTVPAPVATVSRDEEEAMKTQLKVNRPSPYSNLRSFPQDGITTSAPAAQLASIPSVTASPDPAILSLAKNDDLNVSTLAREAKRANGKEGDLNSDEVVVPLH